MTPHFGHPSEKKPATPAKSVKRSRPNALRQAQVMPPHQVDLTLPPATHDDVHVPAHVTGVDLSKEAPADADMSTKEKLRGQKA
jgi:hypothetical protein